MFKRIYKVTSVLVAIIILIGMFPMGAIPVMAQDGGPWSWDGMIPADQLWVVPELGSGEVYMTDEPNDKSTWTYLSVSDSRRAC